MTSVRTTSPDQVDGPTSARCDSVRLSLKPSSSAGGALDGAWWPRSTDPAIELVALSEELAARRTLVRRIGLTMAGWDSAPGRIWLASGRRVAVDWFRISGGHLVRILGTGNQRIDLLLIPVDTDPATAERALTMATDGHDPKITAPSDHHPALVLPSEEAQASWAIGVLHSQTNSPRDDESTPRGPSPSTTAPWATHPATSSAADASSSCHTDLANRVDLPLLDRKDQHHGHGRRIKTRQQLLDEQAGTADSGTTPGDDKNARPHQTYDGTMEHKRPRRHEPLGRSSIPRWRTQDVFNLKRTGG